MHLCDAHYTSLWLAILLLITLISIANGITKIHKVLTLLILVAFSLPINAQKIRPVKPIPPISLGTDGKLVYNADSLGNRVPDYSYAGYKAGEEPIPDVPIKIFVPAKLGDATIRIQSAIDYVASLPLDNKGIRGAILLDKGIYEISGQLKINASGIVFRGSGMGKDGTMLLGSGKDRLTLIVISGKKDRKLENEINIKDAYVPVNAIRIKVHLQNLFKPGDMVIIHRPCTKEWIQKIGTSHFGGGITALGWKPGDRDLYWDRKIISIEGETITLDAPITTAIDSSFGGGTIAKYQWPGRISNIGIENIRCVSVYDSLNLKDEDHRWMAITLENVEDSWVRQVNFEHFAGSAVAVWETSKRITVEDCKSLSPVSEIGGQRRHSFWTTGQQVLFQRLYAEYGYHDFAAGLCASLCAFVQCEDHLPYSYSGGIDSWASGILFDLVTIDGNALCYKNLGQDAQGAGWNASNSVFWNCAAARVDCYAPPTAQNWAMGTWAQFSGDGYWDNSNNYIRPQSLYYAQLDDRLKSKTSSRSQILPFEIYDKNDNTYYDDQINAAANTPINVLNSKKPRLTLSEWIDYADQRNSILIENKYVKTIDQLNFKVPDKKKIKETINIINGRLTFGDRLLTGKRLQVPWWNGTIRPDGLEKALPAITRFVPGRTGTGLTDDLNVLTDSMVHKQISLLEQNYALWYDRRRDDHERIRRMDGDVWPPFYEVPFARCGKGYAWDGLSQYDLNKYNDWYWLRLKQFADLADQKGLVLLHKNYFQHNILEAGAHWVDFPWRSVNNINGTQFPEPPPFVGNTRIYMAEQFYDTTNLVRKAIHKAYIRKCLENFYYNSGVIQLIGEEFTGPYHFVKYWLETISNWEKETGNNAIVGLSVTKDVQDSVLNDLNLSKIVDLIDIRYWAYRDDGSVYAPKGGQNLAPRQHARLVKPGKRTFEQTYRAIREYRDRFPEKAVMYSEDGWDRFGWAIFMAGGSLANIPVIEDKKFLSDAVKMIPVTLPELSNSQYALANSGKGYIIYCNSGDNIKLDLSKNNGNFILRWINPENGRFIRKEEKIKGGKMVELKNPEGGSVVGWIFIP